MHGHMKSGRNDVIVPFMYVAGVPFPGGGRHTFDPLEGAVGGRHGGGIGPGGGEMYVSIAAVLSINKTSCCFKHMQHDLKHGVES